MTTPITGADLFPTDSDGKLLPLEDTEVSSPEIDAASAALTDGTDAGVPGEHYLGSFTLNGHATQTSALAGGAHTPAGPPRTFRTTTSSTVQVPSTPGAASAPNAIDVSWNGLDNQGAALDDSWMSTDIEASLDGTTWRVVGTFAGARGGVQHLGTVSYNADVLVRLVAVYRGKLRSQPSAVGRARPTKPDASITAVPAGIITTGILQAGTVIIAGDPALGHAELSDHGFKTYATDPEGGPPVEAVRLGTDSDDYLGITDANGNNVASIDDLGRGSFNGVEVTGDLLLNGYPLTQTDSGQLVAMAYNPNGDGIVPPGAFVGEAAYYDVAVDIYPDRMYEVRTSETYVRGNVTGNVHQVNIRWAKEAQPTTTSTLLTATQSRECVANLALIIPGANRLVAGYDLVSAADVAAGTNTIRFLLSLMPIQSSGSSLGWSIFHLPQNHPVQLFIRDAGPIIDSTAVDNNSTTAESGTTTSPTPTTSVKTYVSTITANWTQSFRGNGSLRTDTTDAVQGYYSANGDQRALIGFPSVTSMLSGAKVNKVEVYLYANNWWYNSGGTAIIGTHANASPPGYFVNATPDRVQSASWPKPGGRWVTLPSSAWDQFRTGAARGICVGPSGGTNLTYYGRFNGAGASSYKPLLRITYTK
ncbi:MAG: hypothetical protein ACXVYY_00880 [Oryzihumus sp.]